MSEESVITLEDIKRNPVRTVKVPELGKSVKIRDPTPKDRVEALREAKKDNPDWDKLSKLEQDMEIGWRLVIKILVEPKLTLNDFLSGNDTTLAYILLAVQKDLQARLANLPEKIRNFWELQKAG